LKLADSMVIGGLVSLLLAIPILLLDLGIIFHPANATLPIPSLFLPLLIYLSLGYMLKTKGHPRMAWGLAIGGILIAVSFLVILLVYPLVFPMNVQYSINQQF